MKSSIIKLAFFMAILLGVSGQAHGVRIKDIADVKGVRQNQLVGYGLVVGLNGTGDSDDAIFTIQSFASMLERMGVTVRPEDIEVDNVAAVMVTADLPAFVHAGTRIDVLVSSIGDAENLQGGTLLFTPLKGADGQVYAIAQGPVSTGGFSVGSGKDQREAVVGWGSGGKRNPINNNLVKNARGCGDLCSKDVGNPTNIYLSKSTSGHSNVRGIKGDSLYVVEYGIGAPANQKMSYPVIVRGDVLRGRSITYKKSLVENI